MSKPPRKPKNVDVRPREYLLRNEMDLLLVAASKRHLGSRDWLLLETIYRHALRPAEGLHLLWQDIDYRNKVLTVFQEKTGKRIQHPMEADEIRNLRFWQWKQKYEKKYGGESKFVFANSINGYPLTNRQLFRIIRESAEMAGLKELNVHPYMLRHAKGYELVTAKVELRTIAKWFGHKSLETTFRYTDMAIDDLQGLGKLDTRNQTLDRS